MAEPLGRRFAGLWAASTMSALGSGLTLIAAPLYVAAHTRSPLIVSATTGVAWLPWLLFALPGGVLFVINAGEVVFRWLARQRLLRTMAVLIGLLNLTLTAATAVLVLLARERLHLTLATTRSAYLAGFMMFAFGMHGALWSIVGSSLRQRLTPPEMLGRVGSTSLFIAAGGNCAGAMFGGLIAARFGITAPFWAGFVVAVIVSASTWRVFNPAAVAQAYAEPD